MINKERYHDYDVNVFVLLSTLKYNTHTFIYVIKTMWLFNQNNCLNCHKYQTSPFSYCSGFSQPKIWQLLYSVSQLKWSFIPNLMEIIIWSAVSTTKLKMLKTLTRSRVLLALSSKWERMDHTQYHWPQFAT